MRTVVVIGNVSTAKRRDRAIAMAVRVEVEDDRRVGMFVRGDVRVGRGQVLKSGPREPVDSVESVSTWELGTGRPVGFQNGAWQRF